MKSLIFIIGMPGAGKSYWARVWSEAYRWNFADLDKEIEVAAGMTITDIFRQLGEDGFRKLEAQKLAELMLDSKDKTIIACGGGTPVFAGNMEKMLAAGIVIYLNTAIATLLQQIKNSNVPRPLLHAADLKTILPQLLKERAPCYELAHFTVLQEAATEQSLTPIFAACTDLH